MKITVWAILFWRASAYNTCVGQTIIGLSALTEIATFAYNLLKGHILYNKNVIYDFEQNYFLLVLLPLLHTSCLQVTSLISFKANIVVGIFGDLFCKLLFNWGYTLVMICDFPTTCRGLIMLHYCIGHSSLFQNKVWYLLTNFDKSLFSSSHPGVANDHKMKGFEKNLQHCCCGQTWYLSKSQ